MTILRTAGVLLIVLSTVVLLLALRMQWKAQPLPRIYLFVWLIAFVGGIAIIAASYG